MYTFPDGTVRPCAACYGRVHGPFTACSRQHGRPTRAYVYTAVKRPCTRHVHVSVHGQYTSVYTVSTQSCTWQVGLHGCVHGPRRAMYTVVYTSHTQRCTCSSTRPRTRTACRNGPHTVVACRLGTCTRRGRPTCRIHGPDGPYTRPSTRTVTRPCTRYVDGRKRQCSVHGQCTRPKTAVHTARTLPSTRADTARTWPYTRPCVYDRVDGRFRPCTRPLYT